MARDGWSALFSSAFHQSRNPMLLVDTDRRILDTNAAFVHLLGHMRREVLGRPLYTFVAGGPTVTPAEWRRRLAEGRFTGTGGLMHADGSEIGVQWAGCTEMATGRRLVLFVVLSTSRWGAHFRRMHDDARPLGNLSDRERQVVRLVARGETGPEIAAELGIGHETVRTHVRNAMTKLGARSRAHLVAKVLAEHEPEDEASPGP